MEPRVEPMGVEPTRTESVRVCQCWRDLSKTTKIIVVLAGILIAGLIIGGVVFWSKGDSDGKTNNPHSDLEKLAAYYVKNLDQNVEPCDDFYAFTCANLRNEYEKENKSRFDTIAMLGKGVQLSLDDLLTKPLNTFDSTILREMKIFQQMCINKTKVEAEGIEPVLALLKEIGGWPLLSNNWKDTQSWEEVVGSVNRAGFATFFPYYLQFHPDLNNSSGMVMVLTPLFHTKLTRVLPDQKRTMDYVKLVALLLNARNSRIDDDIKDCIVFESKLYEITKSVLEDGEMHTLESLITEYPDTEWISFFRNVFVSTPIEMSRNETVILSHPTYNLKIFELLYNTTTKIIRNYILWRLIEKAIPVMPEKFRAAKNVFEQRTVGQSRNLGCVETLIDKAKVSIGSLYIKNYFDGLAKNKSHGMIESVESQADVFLNNISWMDNDTNRRIIETLRNLETIVSHPHDSIDVMENLEFQSNDTTFANYRRLASSHRNFKYSRLRMSQTDGRQFIPFEYATNANAYFFPLINATYIVAAMFQRPFFSADQPMYLNYGGIGFVIAHEMTHGLRILSVCEDEACPSYDRFRERRECMEKLYGSYVLKQLNETVDGNSTVRENISDLIGLKLSYRAYEEYARGSEAEEPLLPGLNYTARQWFWINAATSFCSYRIDAALKNYILTNEHSPAEARVNVAFANTDEFSRDFACPIGSLMNPVHKCEFQ